MRHSSQALPLPKQGKGASWNPALPAGGPLVESIAGFQRALRCASLGWNDESDDALSEE
jgi:hypothetical protein